MNHKTIVFLVSSMHGGGAERVAALLCNRWAQQGRDVTLMPTFSGKGTCVYSLDERVQLDYLADHVGTTRTSFFSKIGRLAALRRAIREMRPDVVVSFLTDVNVAALLATTGLSVPVVVCERTYPPAMPLPPVLRQLRWWLYARADLVVMQTLQGQDWLRTVRHRPEGRVIPNPVEFPIPPVEPSVLPEDYLDAPRNILAVGRLGPEKQFDVLVRSFAHLADQYPDWNLIILGEGNQRERLEALVCEGKLQGRVYFPGRVGNIGDWYNVCDLFVMSSSFEGFPNALVEAMAHGLPAVSFDCPTGPRDIICDGVDGVLVAPDEGEAGLVREMALLMSDSTARRRMAEQAVAVRDRFSMESVGKLWDEALELCNQDDTNAE